MTKCFGVLRIPCSRKHKQTATLTLTNCELTDNRVIDRAIPSSVASIFEERGANTYTEGSELCK